MILEALISACGQFRWTLTRKWDDTRPLLVFCMLNPSTADGLKDDATIRRCIAFAMALGYGGLIVVNLFAWRTKSPIACATAGWPVGAENDTHIVEAVRGRNVICAWGAHARHNPARVKEVFYLLKQHAAGIGCLGITQEGFPKHPLYLPSNAQLIGYALP